MTRDKMKLKFEHKQNSDTHICDVTDKDYERIAPEIELLKRVSAVQNSTITVYDFHRKNYLLKSRQFKKMLGYSGEAELENNDMELFHDIIHPDDLYFVLDTENRAFKFFRDMPEAEKKDYKLVYDFRVKNSSGVYMRFIHQFAVLEQDKNGRSWLVLIITEVMAEKATDDEPKRKMINMKNGKFCLFSDDNGTSAKKLLTDRETEILSLTAQGLESVQIAKRLFISVHTVNNHRQNILRKIRAKNTTQALLYARKVGIL